MFDPVDIELLTEAMRSSFDDVGQLESALAGVGRVRGRLDAVEARLIRRAEELAAIGTGDGAAVVLRSGQRVSRRQVDRITERAATLAAAPVFEAALDRGAVAADHVDALTRAAASLPEECRGELFSNADLLAEMAATMPADTFERQCRSIARRLDIDEGEARLERQKRRSRLNRWTDAATGMWCLRAELDPESGAVVSAALDAAISHLVLSEAMPRNDRTAAAALVSLASGSGPAGGVRAELLLIADTETWRWGLHEESVSETGSGVPLPPETLRRLSCTADVDTVLLDDSGRALNVGRTRRTATRAQRRALRAMYPTCGFGTCERPFDRCEIHHLHPWNDGGATDLENLVPLCVTHHHRVHEGGWRLHLTPDRSLVVSRGDGTEISCQPLPTAPTARRRADERTEQINCARARAAALVADRGPPP